MALVDELRSAFAPLCDDLVGVLLWGSVASGDEGPRSDLDLCIVAGPSMTPVDALRRAWREVDLDRCDRRVDLTVFEELPRFLQGAVIERHEIVCTPDAPALYEYLYPFRKLWADQAHRQHLSTEEARRIVGGDGTA